jgi:16S rRNA (guanine966-N2)-methyltransferase
MQIIAGSLKGRSFSSPRNQRTHPMSDRVRGALFTILGPLNDLTILDAFSGSGALSFEAVSRGARQVVAIDNDPLAQRAITASIKQLGLINIHLIQANARAWLTTQPDTMFDMVICDPPYDDLQTTLIESLSQRVKPAGLLIVSWPGNQTQPEFAPLQIVARHSYGDAQLIFYR